MTIDERIERLTERHEALAQSVELLAEENRHIAEKIDRMVEENRQRDRRLGEIMEGIASLVHVAEIHEARLTRIEDRQS